MKKELFRSKSLHHISSPEGLHDYIRVTGPRLWMLLAVIAVLLTGFIIFAATASMENVMNIRVNVVALENEESDPDGSEPTYTSLVLSQLPIAQLENVAIGMPVRLGEEKGKISYIGTTPEEDAINIVIEMDVDYVPLPDGEYDAELVLESTTPISFLFN